jgi:hypothetical protein
MENTQMARTMTNGETTRRQAPWYERGGRNKLGLELQDYPADRYGRYAPYPEAGPGRWQVVHKDEIVDAALFAAGMGITADMLAVLRDSDFAKGSLKKRLVEWRKLIHGT